MKLRKLFALLMAAVMLLGMMPMAHAELTGCNHDWDSGKWINGAPANCNVWKTKRYTCTICGDTWTGEECGPCQPGSKTWIRPQGSNCQEYGVWEITCKYCGEWLEGREEPGPHKWSETIVEEPWCDVGGMKAMICSVCGEWQGNGTTLNPLGHNWGSWSWAHGSAPSCTEGAWQVRECQRCGRMEDRWVEGDTHDFGPWKTEWEATCTEKGMLYRTCQRCGVTKYQYYGPIDHSFGEWRVIEEPQVGIPGTERRACIYNCGTHEDREIPPLEEALELPGLELTLTLDSTPANGEYFVVGEEVVFTASWSNRSPFELFPFYVSIWPYEQPSRDSQDLPYSCSFDAEEPITTGMTGSHGMVTTVTEEDVARGGIYAMAFIWSSVHNGPEVEEVTTPFVTAPCDEGMPDLPELHCAIEVANTPANGTHFVPGEEIRFTVTFTNPDNCDLTEVTLLGNISDIPEHKGGQTLHEYRLANLVPLVEAMYTSGSFNFSYTATADDAARGAVYAEAAYWACTTEGIPCWEHITKRITVPCGPGENEQGVLSLTMTPKYEWGPENGSHYVLGESPWTDWTLHNDSDAVTMTLTDVKYYLNGYLFKYWENSKSTRVLTPGSDYVDYENWSYVDADEVALGYMSVMIMVECTGDDGKTYTAEAELQLPCGPGEPLPAVALTKSITSTPANGEYYVPGERIDYDLLYEAFGPGETVSSEDYTTWWPTLYDPLTSKNEDGLVSRSHFAQSFMFLYPVHYTVTEEDAARGYVDNTAFVRFSYTEGGDICRVDSNTVTAPCGFGELPEGYEPQAPDTDGDGIPNDEDPDIDGDGIPNGSDPDIDGDGIPNESDPDMDGDGIANLEDPDTDGDGILNPEDPTPNGVVAEVTIVKGIRNNPANGQYFVPGEVIEFVITAQNGLGQTVDTVIMTDPLSAEFFFESQSIPAGQSATATLSYIVTELDAAIGSVSNYAYAVAYVAGQPQSLTSNTVSADCGFAQGDDPFGILSGLEITKAIESLPANGLYYAQGEKIAYAITVVNSGETRLGETLVYDALYGMVEMGTAEFLEPGESRTYRFSYTVTADDVARGYVYNQAMATYDLNGYTNTVLSNEVVTDTDGNADPVPSTPEWPIFTPVVPGSGISGAGNDHCVTTLTGWNANSIDTRTVFCPDHAATQDTIAIMMSAATDEASQQRVHEYAISLWQADLERMYSAMITASDPAARVYLINEYVQFCAWAGNYGTALTVLCPDQPALVSKLVAQAWQDKCIGLCGEAGSAPAQPTDSLFLMEQGTDAHAAPAAGCALECTPEAGAMACTDVFCKDHSFLFGMTYALLRGENTAAGWERIAQMWQTELNKAYNALYAAAGEDGKAAVIIERNVFEGWLTAREAQLTVLYPENPEIVAEILTREIISHASDLCEVIR